MFLDELEKKNCCGCTACSQVCNFNAIEMKEDERGFRYPSVNKELCRNCGQCEKVCPMRENLVGQEANPDIYALKNKNADVVSQSSSGGMYSLLANWILEQNGSIYGVAFNDEFKVAHKRATSLEEAQAFRTSKYVESDMSQIYSDVVNDLKSGQTVLFTGTPCQVSAMQKFLKAKNVDMTNLFTCDNICHGVPSAKVWKDYVEIIRNRYVDANDEIIFINMRSKKTSWQKQNIEIGLKHGNLDELVEEFSFNRFFLSLFANRTSCFNCRYTSYKRVGDFSIGDFWNVEQAGVDFDIEGGVNVVLVNTEKGKNLFEQIRTQADTFATTKEACWQPHLEYSAKAPNQDKFWNEYNETEDKEVVIRKYLRGSLLTRIIRKFSPILRKLGLYGFAGKMYKLVFGRK